MSFIKKWINLKYFKIILLFIINSNLVSIEIDHLYQKLENAITDSAKVEVYLEISKNYTYYHSNQFKDFNKIIEKGIELSEKNNFQNLKSKLLIIKGRYYLVNNENEKSSKYFKLAETNIKQLPESQQAELFTFLADMRINRLDFKFNKLAHKDYYNALQIYTNLKDTSNIAKTYLKISRNYAESDSINITNSKKYLNKFLNYAPKNFKIDTTFRDFFILNIYYNELEENSLKNKKQLKEFLKYSLENNDTTGILYSYNNLATLAFLENNFTDEYKYSVEKFKYKKEFTWLENLLPFAFFDTQIGYSIENILASILIFSLIKLIWSFFLLIFTPRTKEKLIKSINKKIKKKNFFIAKRLIKKGLKKHKNNYEFQYFEYLVEFELGNLRSAKKSIEKCINLSNLDKDKLALAEIYFLEEDFSQSIEILNEIDKNVLEENSLTRYEELNYECTLELYGKHICKNCGNIFEEKFCNRCGQVKFEKKKHLSFSHLISGFITEFMEIDNKFLNTLKIFLFKPGSHAKNHTKGKIRSYVNLIRLQLVLLASVSVFYFVIPDTVWEQQYIESRQSFDTQAGDKESYVFEEQRNETTTLYMSIFVIYAAVLIVFRKHKKRKMENFMFALSLSNFFIIIFLFLKTMHLFFNADFNAYTVFAIGLMSLYLAFSIRNFYNIKSWVEIIFKTIYTIVIIFIIGTQVAQVIYLLLFK